MTRRLLANATALVAEAERANLDALHMKSLEGHGVEVKGGASGAALGPEKAPWRELLLYDRAGGWRDDACAALPTACAVLRDAPSIVGTPRLGDGSFCCRVEILRLAPGGRVLPHTAPTNARLKAHVGLSTPPGYAASLSVAGERRAWRDGDVFVFDDSFFHEAGNEHASVPRYVLSVDFWKPALGPFDVG